MIILQFLQFFRRDPPARLSAFWGIFL